MKRIIYFVAFVLVLSNMNYLYAFSLNKNWNFINRIWNFNGWNVNNWVKDLNKKKREIEQQIKKMNNVEKKIREKMVEMLNKQKNVLYKISRKNVFMHDVNRVVNNIGRSLFSSKKVLISPIIEDTFKKQIEDKLKNIDNQVVNQISSDVIKKLGITDIKQFKLDMKFDPNKVVTFDDIKRLYISNFLLYQKLLNCSDPDDAVMELCNNISDLLDELTKEDKKLTINDVYKLQVYANTISQAIFYEGALSQFKKGAIVLGIDKGRNVVKSIDLVNTYTEYDTLNNDVLPIVAKEVDIDVQTTPPVANGDDIKIVLGLRGGSVVGLKIYPVEKDLRIPGAIVYKVMTIKGYKRGCDKYTDSIWYGDGKIGLSHEGKNLEPTGMKGIKVNVAERCYDIFGVSNKKVVNKKVINNIKMVNNVVRKIDGRCGNKINTCLRGRLRDISDSSSYYRWQCIGINGGKTVNCSIKKQVNVNCDVLKRKIGKYFSKCIGNGIVISKDGYYVVNGDKVKDGCNNSKIGNKKKCILYKRGKFIISNVEYTSSLGKRFTNRYAADRACSRFKALGLSWELPSALRLRTFYVSLNEQLYNYHGIYWSSSKVWTMAICGKISVRSAKGVYVVTTPGRYPSKTTSEALFDGSCRNYAYYHHFSNKRIRARAACIAYR